MLKLFTHFLHHMETLALGPSLCVYERRGRLHVACTHTLGGGALKTLAAFQSLASSQNIK